MTLAAVAPSLPFDSPAPRATFEHARQQFEAFLPRAGKSYAQRRNIDFGPGKHDAVSGLSPWLRHRLLLETDVLEGVLARHDFGAAEKFVQEVFWRGYFKGWLEHRPEVWKRYRSNLVGQLQGLERDVGLAKRYEEAIQGQTGIACFDAWAEELVQTNYLHNHARMWFASIWIFTLKLPWELGADFFLRNLLDGDPASNTCSWRWVGGLHTVGKTYLARPSNIEDYTGGRFQPAGELAPDAVPLVEPDLGARVPLSFDTPDLAGQRVGLLITVEDCAVHRLDGLPPLQGLFAWNQPVPRSLKPTAPAVDAFGCAAVNEAAKVAEVHFDLVCARPDADEKAAHALTRWAEGLRLDCILTPKLPQGPMRRALLSAVSENGLSCVELTRGYDRAVWPHAKAGFFGLKKKIPSVIAELGLL